MRPWATSLRTRLTLTYAAGLTVILLLYAGGVYAFVSHSLCHELERQLLEDFEEAERVPLDPAGNARIASDDELGHAPHEAELAARWVSIRDEAGSLLHQRTPPGRVALPASADPAFTTLRRSWTMVLSDGERVRRMTGPCVMEGWPVVISVARSERRLDHELRELLWILLSALPVAVGLAGLGGWLLAGRALRPVGEMAEQARTITAERLSARLPVSGEDELGRLATVFNDTLSRLERSFGEMARFTADASHELRTPLAALRSVGEVGLGGARDEYAYRATIGSMLEEADRMARLVEGLLTLARADGARVPLRRERVALGAMAREVASYLEALAEDRGQSISVEVDAEVCVEGDPAILRQAVVNLVDNAIKHGPPDRAIHVRVTAPSDGDVAILEVRDSGPGIRPEHREAVFERFFRADPSRAREFGGTGLGLAIARWAVEAHRGTLDLASGPEPGCAFRIVLPRGRPLDPRRSS